MISACKCFHWSRTLLQKEGPLVGLLSGLLSNTQKWITWGDTRADKARGFTGKGRPGGEQQAEGTQEDRSASACRGFMLMGWAPRLSLANHCVSGSFLVAHASLSLGFQGGSWEVAGMLVLPLDFSWALLAGDGFLAPCSLPGPPVIKWLRKTVTVVPASRAVPVCFLQQHHARQKLSLLLWCVICLWKCAANRD